MGKILIVDDSAMMRRALCTIVKAETGHTVVGEAANGREACEKFKECQPDLVTMDITMPIMSGIEAVKAIRQEAPNARIVMVSTMSEKAMVLEALKAGACDFVLKPIDAARLLQVIRRELGEAPPAPVPPVPLPEGA